LINGIRGWNILRQHKWICQHKTTNRRYSATLVVLLTSRLVVSEILSFLAVRFCVALHGFLGGTRMLASRLSGFSMMTRIFGIPARLNLDRSWNRSCSVSSSPSSEVS
jgi:hypothetical protein